ncbi:hypothetical protein CFOL_v3_27649 [Cephalotus follicularis]|uniref:Uncharacterized protein n=1 Tax=Cephalotus follicularis TaxID=3775 RepID=A0A1Q3CVK8_CEPFO|nr:hypothetical protein CFOL_v3_27649 [Cephalotus follicularis]
MVEIMCRHRSRVFWLKDGDRNTKFFHAKASQRRRRNQIIGIKDDQGVWSDNETVYQQTIKSYFQNIFASDHPVELHRVLNYVDTEVTDAMNRELSADFSRKEIETVLHQINATKAQAQTRCQRSFSKSFGELWGTMSLQYYSQ